MSKHEPRAGRRAYICQHKECKPPRRVFVGPDEKKPDCPEHGRTMVVQPNKRYLGQKVPA